MTVANATIRQAEKALLRAGEVSIQAVYGLVVCTFADDDEVLHGSRSLLAVAFAMFVGEVEESARAAFVESP